MEFSQKRICFIVNSGAFFLSHRAVIAKELLCRGAEVHVITAPGEGVEEIRRLGMIHHSANINRSGKNIVSEIATLFTFVKLLRQIQPDLIHLVTIKPMLYGGVAAKLLGLENVVSAVSGLGHTFSANTPKTRILRAILKPLFILAFRAKNSRVIFQNTSDRDTLLDMGVISNSRVRMIKGSGVDLELYKPCERNSQEVVVVFAARLLKNKGVCEFVDAAQRIQFDNPDVRFIVVGDPDPSNPLSVSSEDIRQWQDESNVEFLGFRRDIPEIFSQADIVALPSYYGEGLPKVLIEAAACGRAIVTTDHPGCRDAVIADQTGLVVPSKNVDALVKAFLSLIESTEKRKQLGKAARRFAEKEFDVKGVVQKHVDIYSEILER